MTNEQKFELDSEVVVINNVPQLKVSYIKETTNKEGAILNHSEGYEFHQLNSAEAILEGEIARTKSLKDTKTRKVILRTEDHKWLECQKRISQHNDCQNKMKKSGVSFDDHLKDEQKNFEKQQEVQAFWQEAVTKLKLDAKTRAEELKKTDPFQMDNMSKEVNTVPEDETKKEEAAPAEDAAPAETAKAEEAPKEAEGSEDKTEDTKEEAKVETKEEEKKEE